MSKYIHNKRAHAPKPDRIRIRDRPRQTHIAANIKVLQYVLKADRSAPSLQPYSQYNPRPTPTTQHGNRLNRANQLRKPTKRTPDDSWLSQPQHNNRECFTSNISILNARKPGFCVICLVCSCFSPHEMPAHLRAFRYITQSRSAQHRPLQSPRKFSSRRLE